jgi:hypothetical protein
MGIGEPLAWRAPGGPLVPAVVILTAAATNGSLFLKSPKRAALGLARLLSGFPICPLWRGLRRRHAG